MSVLLSIYDRILLSERKTRRNHSMKKFVCTVCDYVFEGDELPEDYECPLCGVGPDQFEEEA